MPKSFCVDDSWVTFLISYLRKGTELSNPLRARSSLLNWRVSQFVGLKKVGNAAANGETTDMRPPSHSRARGGSDGHRPLKKLHQKPNGQEKWCWDNYRLQDEDNWDYRQDHSSRVKYEVSAHHTGDSTTGANGWYR